MGRISILETLYLYEINVLNLDGLVQKCIVFFINNKMGFGLKWKDFIKLLDGNGHSYYFQKLHFENLSICDNVYLHLYHIRVIIYVCHLFLKEYSWLDENSK